MSKHFCCFINYSEGEDACGKIARCKHGDSWLCAAHYDLVQDYISGRGTGCPVWGCDLSMNQEPVFVVAYE